MDIAGMDFLHQWAAKILMPKKKYFKDKFSSKSDQELYDIIESQHQVMEARLAARWILDHREEQTAFQLPNNITRRRKTRRVRRNPKPAHRILYEWRMIAFGMGCIITAFYINFDNLINTKDPLMEFKGTINETDVIVNVSGQNSLENEAQARRATLYFRLNEHQKLFRLTNNSGQQYSDEQYKRISGSLKNAREVCVWIHENELEKTDPEVFQIEIDNQTILESSSTQSDHSGIFILLLLLGSAMIGLAFYRMHP